jgi:MoaD family protein
MAVKIHIPTPMRQYAAGTETVEAAGGTVGEALTNLGLLYPDLKDRIFEEGQVKRFINVFLNDEDVRYMSNLETSVKDGDEISIIPAVAGG